VLLCLAPNIKHLGFPIVWIPYMEFNVGVERGNGDLGGVAGALGAAIAWVSLLTLHMVVT